MRKIICRRDPNNSYKLTRPKGKGIPVEDTWNCSAKDVLNSVNIQAFVKKTGYPTEKPIGLYERIIKASSNEREVVLDPFAGSGTTCIAAERLNRQWVGIDLWEDGPESYH